MSPKNLLALCRRFPGRTAAGGLLTLGMAWVAVATLNAEPTPRNEAAFLARGQELFEHVWTVNDSWAAAGGDGLGPVFNAKSCVACHFQGGVGGSGPVKNNVMSFVAQPVKGRTTVVEGVIHTASLSDELLQSRADVHNLYPIRPPTRREIAPGCWITTPAHDPVVALEVSTPALFGVGLIASIPESAIVWNELQQQSSQVGDELRGQFLKSASGRVRKLKSGEIGRFGWKAQFSSLKKFVATACAVETGLSNSIRNQDCPTSFCPDEHAKLDLSDEQVDQLWSYCASLPRPEQILPADPVALQEVRHGEQLFSRIGCASCHTPSLGGVDGLYSDLLLHVIEPLPQEGGGYGDEPEVPLPDDFPLHEEWKSTPLWGVADTAPYFHDGRSPTLESAILRHAGEGKAAMQAYRKLQPEERAALIAFLNSLKLPRSAKPVPTPPQSESPLVAGSQR